MKKIVLFAICLFLGKLAVSQVLFNEFYQVQNAEQSQILIPGSPDFINSRLTGYSTRTFSNGSWEHRDSLKLTWSGAKGGDYFSTLGLFGMWDQMQTCKWLDSTWENDFLAIDAFDENGYITSRIFKRWWGTWENLGIYYYEYDEQGFIVGITLQDWNAGVFENVVRRIYGYDTERRLVELTELNWSGEDWVNAWRQVYGYDANGNRTELTESQWYESAWRPSYERTYTFETNNKLTHMLQLIFTGMGWKNSFQSDYEYDTRGNLVHITSMTAAPEWVNSYATSMIYDTNDYLLDRTEYTWNGLDWENSERTLQEWDALGNVVSKTEQNWTGIWSNVLKREYTYNSYHQWLTILNSTWDGDWQPSRDSTFYYEEYNDGLNVNAFPVLEAKVFPNPFIRDVAFTMEIPGPGILKCSITDVYGHLVYSNDHCFPGGSHAFYWDGNDLTGSPVAPGVYIYRFQTGTSITSGKLIKQ